MKVGPREINKHLKSLDPAIRAVLIFGRDEGLVREYGDTIGQQIVEDIKDPFNVSNPTMENVKAQPSTLLDEVAALSMMGGRRLIKLEGATNDAKTAVDLVLKSTEGDGLLLVTAGDLPTSSALRKMFEAHPKALSIACYSDDVGALANLIHTMLDAAGLTITQDAMQYLMANLGADRQITRRELEKLILYMGAAETNITLEDVQTSVGDSAALMLSHVAEATTGGDIKKLEKTIERAAIAGENAIAILRVLENRLMQMHLARGYMESHRLSARAAVDKLRPPVFFKEKDALINHVERWPLKRLSQALQIVSEAEADCKSTGMPVDTITARTCLRLARAAR